MPSEDLVERVARAIYEADGADDPADFDRVARRYRRLARAALAAMPQPEPIGYTAIGTYQDEDDGPYRGTIFGPGSYEDCVQHIEWASRSLEPPTDPTVVALVPVEVES